MKKGLTIMTWTTLLVFGCSKEADIEVEKCGCDGTKTETVDNIFGLVVETTDGFEIITDEKGILKPCTELTGDIAADFQPVTLSGQLRLNCNEISGYFKITPIEINEITIRATNYNKTDITLTIVRSEDYGYEPGFGYFIEDKRTTFGTRWLQPHIPAVGGLSTFDSEDKAVKTGLLSIFSVRGQSAYITPEILEYIKVVQ
ncbi:MAG: hypothetical protein QY309_13085 [Cyclobacteriaceae bacterium]|nr:MAG: hypothetical protein QY309_13050 [Cyclobacteriaceae bacterium]WKZ58800.1 MAG: hypothetical protein QY309_13085 [Cyclobacteriaceae bacterium]